MRVGVVYGGPGSGTSSTSVIFAKLTPAFVRAINTGVSTVFISTDAVGLANGSAGSPLAPNERFDPPYAMTQVLYAITPSPTGGELDVETISIAAAVPVAAVEGPLEKAWKWLTT